MIIAASLVFIKGVLYSLITQIAFTEDDLITCAISAMPLWPFILHASIKAPCGTYSMGYVVWCSVAKCLKEHQAAVSL